MTLIPTDAPRVRGLVDPDVARAVDGQGAAGALTQRRPPPRLHGRQGKRINSYLHNYQAMEKRTSLAIFGCCTADSQTDTGMADISCTTTAHLFFFHCLVITANLV